MLKSYFFIKINVLDLTDIPGWLQWDEKCQLYPTNNTQFCNLNKLIITNFFPCWCLLKNVIQSIQGKKWFLLRFLGLHDLKIFKKIYVMSLLKLIVWFSKSRNKVAKMPYGATHGFNNAYSTSFNGSWRERFELIT